MKQLSTLIILLFLHIGSLIAQQDKVDAIIRREMQSRRIPGVQLAVVKDGKIILERNYGIANIEQNIPVTDSTLFSINSCTKAFTGVAIMQLVQAGKIDLQAPVGRYLDSLPANWQPVTIRQLLTHVSGLPDVLQLKDVSNEKQAWQQVMAKPMDFPTGTQFSYNQTNYALLGKIIDKYSGMPFLEFFQQQQFRPAGMKYTVSGDFFSVIPHSADTYIYARYLYGEKLPTAKLIKNYEEFAPYRRAAAGLKSTAHELASWIAALQRGQLLNAPALKTLWTAGSYNNGQPTQWALGWVTKPRPAHAAIIATGGARSAFFVYPEDHLGIVVLTNLNGGTPEDFIDEIAGVFNPAIPLSDPVTYLRMKLDTVGYSHAMEIYQQAKKSIPAFQPGENDLNDWAYRMMAQGKLKNALAIFQLNTYLYPDSWNVYDSYGEALLKDGQQPAAEKMYRKSVELNPQNSHGKAVLEQLH
ncbi:CubicO group peptidase (beta-lactamase class C family) [Chitinophaga dinghuensis]|uniref:CubicO group peptidase (Beta-lactamase class C family) n=1 Tax=Chitinophaga dinghuensis TaxID=1539050 RepID=A0A327W5K3_9BACT|nr:serine hydrolase [Chitinophaga dinghuensis]RAJ83630.1 CubicO group peptidase (beta-lactamase class C family) [Chitinophaga dinghuensis]